VISPVPSIDDFEAIERTIGRAFFLLSAAENEGEADGDRPAFGFGELHALDTGRHTTGHGDIAERAARLAKTAHRAGGGDRPVELDLTA